MREHVVNYFKGEGLAKDRWMIDTPEFSADASTATGNLIGGRLDWVKFSDAAKRLLPACSKSQSHFLTLSPCTGSPQ